MRKLVVLIFALTLAVTPLLAQENAEEQTPKISARNVKVETIKNKRKVVIRASGVIQPKKIVKSGKPSKQAQKEEHFFDEALLAKLEVKEARKKKIEEQKLEQWKKANPNALAATPDVAPKATFDIGSDTGSPPDNTVAISKTGFIVAADNSEITFLREDGTELDSFTYPDFLGELDASVGNNTADPKVIYDPEENKFIFFIQSGSSGDTSRCVLMFSSSDDPTDEWRIYEFNTVQDDGLWFDYPSLSVNYHEVFLTGNLFNDDRRFSGNVIYAFDKDDGYEAREVDGLEWRDIDAPGSLINASGIIAVPASRSRMYGPGHYLLSTSAMGGGDVFLYHITGHLQSDPGLDKYRIDIDDYEVAPSAAQRGTSRRLQVGDCRITSAYYQNGKVYFVFTKDDGQGFSGISYNRIRISDLAVKSKFFHDNQSSDYAYAAICNRGENESYSRALLVFQRSGSTTFPQIRKRLLKADMSAVSASSSIRNGASFRDQRRWGDYIGVQRKYGTSVAWMTGHTPDTSNQWRTHLISIDLP